MYLNFKEKFIYSVIYLFCSTIFCWKMYLNVKEKFVIWSKAKKEIQNKRINEERARVVCHVKE